MECGVSCQNKNHRDSCQIASCDDSCLTARRAINCQTVETDSPETVIMVRAFKVKLPINDCQMSIRI